MANSDWDEDNPYASPKGIVRGPAQKDQDEFVIEPWLLLRDWIDNWSLLLVSCEESLLLFLVCVGTCVAACCWLGGPELEGVVIGIGIGVVLLLPVAIYELRRRVRRLRVDGGGITLERRLGKSTLLPWEDVRRIRPATRREVLIYLCLWLWLEPTKSDTTAGHYRIEWTGGYFYFPPKDPLLFERAVRRFCPRLLGEE